MKKILTITTLLLLIFLNSHKTTHTYNQKEIFSKEIIQSEVKFSSLKSRDIILLDNGSYIVIELLETEYPYLLNYNISSTGKTFTKLGTKNVTMYDKSDKILWNYFLSGFFLVNPGVSSTAISSSYLVTNDTNFWHFSNGNSSYENNVIKGEGTFKHKALFITIKTVSIDISITSDIYGNTK